MEITKVTPPLYKVGKNSLNEYELRRLMLEVALKKRRSGIKVIDQVGLEATILKDGSLSCNLHGTDIMSLDTLKMIALRREKSVLKLSEKGNAPKKGESATKIAKSDTVEIPLLLREYFLNCIFENFAMASQWTLSAEKIAFMHKQASTLIEILEVSDCGSIGGYDPLNKIKHITDFRLYNRFLALIEKTKSAKCIKVSCGMNLKTMKAYFDILSKAKSEAISIHLKSKKH